MNKLTTLLCALLLLMSAVSFGADDNLINGVTLNEIDGTTEIAVRDSWYTQYVLNTDDDYFTTLSSNVWVKLWFDDSERKIYGTDWTAQVDFTITLTDEDGTETSSTHTLTIDYDHLAAYKDKEWKLFDDAIYIKAVLSQLSVTVTGTTGGEIPVDAHLDLELKTKRFYNLDADEKPDMVEQSAISLDGIGATAEEIMLSWTYVEGAESYDFEWLFVDEPIADLSTVTVPDDFKDATRVNVLQTAYNVSLAYPRGVFFFRVRGVGKEVVDGKVIRVEGPWSTGDYASTTEGYRFEYEGLLTDMNWQYQVNFAQEGKRGESIGFYDGSLKPRQSVSLNNSDNTAIIGETVYDYLGRPSMSLLPVPEETKGLGFYPDKLDLGGDDFYDYTNFDVSGKYDSPDDLGASEVNSYYNSGSSIGHHKDYVADADDFPFARTTFTKDGTGRVRTQTAVGGSLIGAKDFGLSEAQITTYLYGTPTQEELYRLFGNEVGNALHYKKNVVLDQNDQAHIQYLDKSGRVIATFLGGDAPENLLEIDSYPESFDEIVADLTVNNTFNEDGELVVSKRIVVPYATTYDFDYSLAGVQYLDDCITDYGPLLVTEDIKYDLTIYIENQDLVHEDLGLVDVHYDGEPVHTYYYEGLTSQDLIEFSVSLSPGEYTIVKKLKINEAYLTLLKIEYFTNQDCFVEEVTDGTPCNPTCEDVCFDKHGYVNEAGNRVFHTADGDLVAEEIIVDEVATYNFYGDYDASDPVWLAILADIATCETSCEAGVIVTHDPCEITRNRLLADMSPGGQYFDNTPFGSFEPTTGGINGWLVDESVPYVGGYTNWDDVRANWTDAFAEILLEHHPEYCFHVMTCGESLNEVSCTSPKFTIDGTDTPYPDCPSGWTGLEEAAYDYLMTTTEDVAMDGTAPLEYLFNPTDRLKSTAVATVTNRKDYQFATDNAAAGLPDDEVDPFLACRELLRSEIDKMLKEFYLVDGTISDYHSIWYVIKNPQDLHTDWASHGYTSAVGDFYTMLHDPTDGVIGDPADGKISPYQFFKGYYEYVKNYVEYHFMDDHAIACPAACIGVTLSRINSPENNGLDTDGFLIHYPENPVFDDFASGYTYAIVEADFDDACETVCESNADYWMSQLDGCVDPASTDYSDARDYLIAICQAGCDEDNPSGTDNISPSTVTGPWGAMSSFDEVIDELNSRSGDGCDYIVHPDPDLADYEDDCDCNQLTNFVRNFYISVGLTVPDAFDAIAVDLSSGATDYTDEFLETLEEFVSDEEEGDVGFTLPTVSGVQDWLDDCTAGTVPTDLMDAFTCAENYPTSVLEDFETDCGDELDALENHYNHIEHENNILEGWLNYLANYTNTAWSGITTREVFTMTFDLHEYHYTLFYYDQAGNLIKTVPPAGIYRKDNNGVAADGIEDEQSSTLTAVEIQDCKDYVANPNENPYTHPLHELVTNYKYNSLQQLIEQTTPDGGTTHYWYDALGRLIVSQNDRQAAAAGYVYSYTVYDPLGRVTEAGEVMATSAMNDAIGKDAEDYYLWHTNKTKTEVIKTVYNAYQETTTEISTALGVSTDESELNLRGRIGSVVYYGAYDPLDLNDFDHANHYLYDYAGNVKTVLQENKRLVDLIDSSVDLDEVNELDLVRTDYNYDLISGNVIQVDYQNGKIDQFHYKYDYDANNRLTTSYSSNDGEIWQKESKNFYYAHGPLARQEIGDQIVQACDYVYTINGWLKAVNSSVNDVDDITGDQNDAGRDGQTAHINQNIGKDAFGFSLHYFEGDYSAVNTTVAENLLVNITSDIFGNTTHDLYNGNIHQMVTSLNDIDENGLGVLANKYRYDQLQRIKSSDVYQGTDIRDKNEITIGGVSTSGEWSTTYTFDGNGNLLTLNRADADGDAIDQFSYHYNYTPGTDPTDITTNQLKSISDAIGLTISEVDVDNQVSDNYSYDEIGQLIQDKSNDIDEILWTVTGKVKRINYDNDLNTALNTSTQHVIFEYDAMGNRISKEVYTKVSVPATLETAGYFYFTTTNTYYMYDASGNVLATYVYEENVDESGEEIIQLNEHHIFGNKRIGLRHEYINMTSELPTDKKYQRILGEKSYELSNHLGNVLATVSDRKLAVEHDLLAGVVDHYEADVQSYSEYYPYGMVLRSGTDGSSYRYGFQGQEDDPELKGEGNSTNYKYRMHDPRIGRFFATDPLEKKYPYLTPYQFSSNQPIHAPELEGLESAAEFNIMRGQPASANGAMSLGRDLTAGEQAFFTRLGGGLQVVGGAFEMVGGGVMIVGSAGFATVPGALVAGHGIDNVVTGTQTIITGESTQTLTSQAIEGTLETVGVDPETAHQVAEVTDMAIGITGGITAGNKMLANSNKLSNTRVFSSPVVLDDIPTNPNAFQELNIVEELHGFTAVHDVTFDGVTYLDEVVGLFNFDETTQIYKMLNVAEARAVEAGAEKIIIRGINVAEDGFTETSAWFSRQGFTMQNVNAEENTFEIVKVLNNE